MQALIGLFLVTLPVQLGQATENLKASLFRYGEAHAITFGQVCDLMEIMR